MQPYRICNMKTNKGDPNLPKNPTHRVLSLGGGKQSSVMLLMAAEEAFGPTPDITIFADTGWEPQSVYQHLDWLESISTLPIVRVSSGRDLKDETASWTSGPENPDILSLPVFLMDQTGRRGMLQHRQCTDHFKLQPIQQYIRREIFKLVPRQRMPKDAMIEMWLGISTDEASRMRDNHNPWAVNRYPLIEAGMSRSDCERWFAERYPERQLPRSACSGCPFRSDAEWLSLKQTNPDDFTEAARVDKALREVAPARGLRGTPYLHSRCEPLEDAVHSYERHLEMNPMLPGLESGAENDCTGLCFA